MALNYVIKFARWQHSSLYNEARDKVHCAWHQFLQCMYIIITHATVSRLQVTCVQETRPRHRRLEAAERLIDTMGSISHNVVDEAVGQ